MEGKKGLFKFIADLLFVPKCAGCGERMLPNEKGCLCGLCAVVYDSERDKECAKCGKDLSHCSCSTENLQKAKIEVLSKLTVYRPHSNDFVINQMIFKLKKTSEYNLVEFLSHELASSIENVIQPTEDFIVTYAPRSDKAMQKYGYDHMEFVSRRTAKLLGLKWAKLLKRHSNVEQKTLSYTERLKNIALSFDNPKNVDIKGKHIILMDDIVTSGATLCAGARKLRKNGAKSVVCAVIAISRSTYIKYRIKKKAHSNGCWR